MLAQSFRLISGHITADMNTLALAVLGLLGGASAFTTESEMALRQSVLI